jgi:hypothetical protein
MKIKPKEVMVNLPVYFSFSDPEKIPEFAMNINSILSGKSRIKYDEMGIHDGETIAIFYLYRDNDYSELREFVKQYLIDENQT